jgi:hypothetical protein
MYRDKRGTSNLTTIWSSLHFPNLFQARLHRPALLFSVIVYRWYKTNVAKLIKSKDSTMHTVINFVADKTNEQERYHRVQTFLFFSWRWGGVGLVPKRGCLLTLAYYTFPRWYEFGERRWNDILTGENRRTRRKTCPSATLSTTNPTRIDPGANPGLRGKRRATNDLSHGTALSTDKEMWGFHGAEKCIKVFWDVTQCVVL